MRKQEKMSGKQDGRDSRKYILLLLLLGAILANIKSIFIDCDIDTEYAVAMSYRMLQGDGMLRQMWEPHQTSAFLCTFLMKPFLALTGGTTGIVLYLHVMGVLLHSIVVWVFYTFMKKRVDLNSARLMSIFFLTVRPKDIVFPEFSNMQIWFSVLLFLSLIYYLENQNKKQWLILSSFFLCLEVLSYPSCLIVWLPVAAILWIYSEKKWKDILIFTSACVIQGCAYTVFCVGRAGGVKEFFWTLQQVVYGDASHQGGSAIRKWFFWENLLISLLWLGGSFVVALLINKLLMLQKSDMTEKQRKGRLLLLTGVIALMGLVLRMFFMSNRMAHISLYLLIIALALKAVKKCDNDIRRLVYVGMSLSAGSFVATALLTNLDISSTLMYLSLAVMVAFVPLQTYRQQEVLLGRKVLHYDAIVLFCIIVLFQRGIMVKTLGGFSDPLTIGGIVRSGPEIGIISDYMGTHIRNTTMEEWDSFVQDGDNILIVEKEGTSTIGYLYNDTNVSSPSVICTPTNEEQLLEYWQKYPEKLPDVVVVQCWYGEVSVESSSWIMQWLEEEFKADTVSDGTFWRFYRKN